MMPQPRRNGNNAWSMFGSVAIVRRNRETAPPFLSELFRFVDCDTSRSCARTSETSPRLSTMGNRSGRLA